MAIQPISALSPGRSNCSGQSPRLYARRATGSTPWWPPRIVPPEGAPNVLLIMTDDQGYGVSSTFGGVIPTLALDRIAAAGLRYTQFHSTALCSPTRAALITGRNHHTGGFGVITELSTGFPGYDSIIGPENVRSADPKSDIEQADELLSRALAVDPNDALRRIDRRGVRRAEAPAFGRRKRCQQRSSISSSS